MNFDFYGIEIPIELYNEYINGIINKIFAILPIYEDCCLSQGKNFEPYESHINKIITQLIGSEILFDKITIMKLTTILKGMQKQEDLNKKKIKSLVFHCIDIVTKFKKSGG